jgi:hypothetical protein
MVLICSVFSQNRPPDLAFPADLKAYLKIDARQEVEIVRLNKDTDSFITQARSKPPAAQDETAVRRKKAETLERITSLLDSHQRALTASLSKDGPTKTAREARAWYLLAPVDGGHQGPFGGATTKKESYRLDDGPAKSGPPKKQPQ